MTPCRERVYLTAQACMCLATHLHEDEHYIGGQPVWAGVGKLLFTCRWQVVDAPHGFKKVALIGKLRFGLGAVCGVLVDCKVDLVPHLVRRQNEVKHAHINKQ